MKITSDTSDRLILDSRPVFIGLALIGGTVLLLFASFSNFNAGDYGKAGIALAATVGLMVPALFVAVERVQVILDARAGTCTLRRRTMRGYSETVYDLGEISRAMVQTRKNTDRGADSHRVALVIGADTLENRHGLTNIYKSGPRAHGVTDRINAWLSEHRAQDRN